MAELTDKIESLRKSCKALLIQAVRAPESLLNCHVVSVFLGISERQMYRWLRPDSVWLPDLDACRKITDFLGRVKETREFWPELIKTWPRVPESIKLSLFPRNLRRTLDDKGLTTAEKSEDLTIQVLRILHRLVTEEAKKEKADGNT